MKAARCESLHLGEHRKKAIAYSGLADTQWSYGRMRSKSEKVRNSTGTYEKLLF